MKDFFWINDSELIKNHEKGPELFWSFFILKLRFKKSVIIE